MPDSMSITSGVGPLVSAPPVNPQTQVNVAKQQAADAGMRQATEGASRPQSGAPTNDAAKNTNVANGTENRVPAMEEKTLTLEQAVESFKEYVDKLPSDLQFQFDKDSDRHFFKILNPVTREVVRQFPSEEFLTMVRRLREVSGNTSKSNGVFLDDRT